MKVGLVSSLGALNHRPAFVYISIRCVSHSYIHMRTLTDPPTTQNLQFADQNSGFQLSNLRMSQDTGLFSVRRPREVHLNILVDRDSTD